MLANIGRNIHRLFDRRQLIQTLISVPLIAVLRRNEAVWKSDKALRASSSSSTTPSNLTKVISNRFPGVHFEWLHFSNLNSGPTSRRSSTARDSSMRRHPHAKDERGNECRIWELPSYLWHLGDIRQRFSTSRRRYRWVWLEVYKGETAVWEQARSWASLEQSSGGVWWGGVLGTQPSEDPSVTLSSIVISEQYWHIWKASHGMVHHVVPPYLPCSCSASSEGAQASELATSHQGAMSYSIAGSSQVVHL